MQTLMSNKNITNMVTIYFIKVYENYRKLLTSWSVKKTARDVIKVLRCAAGIATRIYTGDNSFRYKAASGTFYK